MSNRQAGRPSTAEQLVIKRTLWPYFEVGSKTIDVFKETGIDPNTIKKYFKIWGTKIFKLEEEEFFRACKLAKEEALLKIEIRLEKLEAHSDKLEAKLEAVDWSISPEYAWVHMQYERLQVRIVKLESEKYNLESMPTADIRLKTDVNRILKKPHDLGGLDHV